MNQDMLSGRNLWLLGCGAMGGALLSNWLDAGLDPAAVTIVDPAPTGLPVGYDLRQVASLAEAGAAADILVLAIKPQMLPAMTADIAAVASGALLVSMLAGVRTTTLSHLFADTRLVRIMPNLTVRIGRGVTAMFPAGATTTDDRATIDRLMAPTGLAMWLEEEGAFDAVTAVSGCGPAFLFRFIETLAGAGEAAGIEPEAAAKLALETIAGAAAMAAQSPLAPAVLRQQVTSPNGVTQAGLDVLDGDGALSALMRATVRAASERSRALAAAADMAADS